MQGGLLLIVSARANRPRFVLFGAPGSFFRPFHSTKRIKLWKTHLMPLKSQLFDLRNLVQTMRAVCPGLHQPDHAGLGWTGRQGTLLHMCLCRTWRWIVGIYISKCICRGARTYRVSGHGKHQIHKFPGLQRVYTREFFQALAMSACFHTASSYKCISMFLSCSFVNLWSVQSQKHQSNLCKYAGKQMLNVL